jgi:hypothetical protein
MIRTVLLAAALISATGVAVGSPQTPSTDGLGGGTLLVSKGTVMVDNGSGYVAAKNGQMLKTGDRVMVLNGANASLRYANGRSVGLPPSTMADVGMSNVSAFGNQRKIGRLYAQTNNLVGKNDCFNAQGAQGACGGKDFPYLSNPTATQTSNIAWIASLVALGVITIAVATNDDHAIKSGQQISAP